MSLLPLFSILLFFMLCSCGLTRQQENQNKETPTALQEKSNEVSFLRRGHTDLVDNLYNELVEKTPELKELERQIAALNKRQPDSTGAFERYHQNSKSYYRTANSYLESIRDSVLRQKIKAQINNSLAGYQQKISGPNSLIKIIDTQNILLDDLHTALKLVRTLPAIEQYQKDHLPSTVPLEGIVKDLKKTIEQTKKQGQGKL